jgi:hypothetical protein
MKDAKNTEITITGGRITIRKDKWYVVLNLAKDKDEKRKEKWIATGLDAVNEKGELINETLAKQKLDDLILEYGQTENIAPANFTKKREPFAQAKITICVHKKCTVIKILY